MHFRVSRQVVLWSCVYSRDPRRGILISKNVKVFVQFSLEKKIVISEFFVPFFFGGKYRSFKFQVQGQTVTFKDVTRILEPAKKRGGIHFYAGVGIWHVKAMKFIISAVENYILYGPEIVLNATNPPVDLYASEDHTGYSFLFEIFFFL